MAATTDEGGLLGHCRDFCSRRRGFLESQAALTEDYAAASPIEAQLRLLKAELLGLVSDDVSLVETLVGLAEGVEELKGALSRTSSRASLHDHDATPHRLQLNASDYTSSSGEDTSPVRPPRKQYFSRQNSVLRIPIPPSHRRESLTHSRLKTIPSLPSPPDEDETSSGVSSQSGGSVRSSKGDPRSRPASIIHIASEEEDVLGPLCAPPRRHEAQTSVDSGINLLQSPLSPDTVFV